MESKAGSAKAQYSDFVKILVRKLVDQLSAEELRSVSGTLTSLINERLQSAKPAKKQPAKGVKLAVEKKITDDYGDGDYGDDDEERMF